MPMIRGRFQGKVSSRRFRRSNRVRRPEHLATLGLNWRGLEDKLILGLNVRGSYDAVDIDGSAMDDYEVVDINASFEILRGFTTTAEKRMP